MGNELFIEIGCEEIPARFLENGLASLSRLVGKLLDELGLTYGEIRTAGTPRRMALSVADVPRRQPDKTYERIGPAKAVAFDEQGQPTKAAVGFARGQGLGVGDLSVVSTEKGQYVAVRKHEPGLEARVLLARDLPERILAIPWPKSMRWGGRSERFVRPVHWIVAMLDGQVIEFTLFGLKSAGVTYGHRFLSPEAMPVRGFDDYVESLRGSNVIPLIDERRGMIEAEMTRIGEQQQCTVVPDTWLVNHVANLVEFPVALTGSFDEAYLELPREVLVTTLRDHQKYFVVEDHVGELMPRFVTVSNMLVPDADVVIKGNERVLAARLEDAKFYFSEDLKKPMDRMAEGLSGVLFQADLGSYAEKTQRIRRLAEHLAGAVAPEKKDLAVRAASLAKADLVSGVVGEFPELQGIMGMHYARHHKEGNEVAEAIREHYLPKGLGADLPGTELGALVALADKLDTICGCYGVGLAPTGSGDPFALRRAALGVIHILEHRRWLLDLQALVAFAVAGVQDKILAKDPKVDSDEQTAHIVEFLRQRLANLLKGDGLPTATVDAVLSVRFGDLVEAKRRAEAVATFARQGQFEPFAVAFKRAANILATATDDFAAVKVDPALFDHEAEGALLSAVEGIEAKVAELTEKGDNLGALQIIAKIRPQVDDFFDGPLVMHDDDAIRKNRLALLARVNALFRNIADFKKI